MLNMKERPRLDVFNAKLIEGAVLSEPHGFPIQSHSFEKPDRAIPFKNARKCVDCDQWIHFFIHDFEFECVWRQTNRYIPLFKRFKGVISPCYSLYRDMPLSMQIWNTYRNRALGYWLSKNGIPTIPYVGWSDERSYSFAFEGLPQGGTVCVSTNGVIRNRGDRFYFQQGLKKMVARLCPNAIVCYGYMPDDVFDIVCCEGIKLVNIEHIMLSVRKTQGK
jgi:hypothetical protein